MKQRAERLQEKLQDLGFDAYLVTNAAKVRYLTGFCGTGEAASCLVTPKEVYLIVTPRDKEQAFQESQECEVIVQSDAPELDKIAEKNLIELNHRKIGVELDVAFQDFYLLQKEYPGCEIIGGSDCHSISSSGLVDAVSAIKEPEEIEKIQEALRLTEHIFQKHILPRVKPGITEGNLAEKISSFGKKHGAEKDAFDIIIASGERAAVPHAFASSKKLQEGNMVQFDFGYVIGGYPSDFSRVVFLGEPTERQKEIYNIVLVAQEMAIRAARPGMKCRDLDKVARDYIESKGYEIPHALGHGLGIMVHSAPRIGPGDDTTLEPGYVVTIEPGIYISGWGGVRIEDVVVITEDGCCNLTTLTKEMIVIN
jgi:Xaa-Pro aminopeptidase